MISMLVIMDSIYILKGNLQKEKKDTDRNGIFLKVKVVGSNPGYQKLEKNISQLFHTRFELQKKINGILLPKLF